jgi:hypothetical protein
VRIELVGGIHVAKLFEASASLIHTLASRGDEDILGLLQVGAPGFSRIAALG